jgi:hypothetical protein
MKIDSRLAVKSKKEYKWPKHIMIFASTAILKKQRFTKLTVIIA